MTRGTFLSTLAAAAACAQPRPPLRIAFLGASHSHAADKIRLVRASPDWDLAGVAEDDPLIQTPGIPRLTRDQLLTDKSISVVAVESAVARHESDALAALEAGKHVHVEKPLAHTAAGLNKVVAAARARKLQLQSGYMWRYNPAVRTAMEAARKGWLGDIYLVRGMMNTLVNEPERREEWGLFPGGQMFEQGSHLIDIVARLLGRPLKIQSTLRSHGPFEDGMKDNTVAILEYKSALGIIQASTLQPGAFPHRTLEIFGSNGNAVVRPIEPPTLEIDLAQPAGPYKAGRQKFEPQPYQRYVGDFQELAAAIRGERPLTASLDEELLVHQVILWASEMN
ncbi:MAG: Gfo/Idh/MocA family oxidoreductase [Bryobacteraceae bacterium]|nr:Gfo/Idh/MocA family oxidoreductase [Bryobacteraceae bacterium]